MCGINGILNFKHEQVCEELISGMNSKIIHRGPDDEGVWTENNIGIGMRRLSIIDISGGHQPIISKTGRFVIVLNGEIYNYLELREELIKKGHKFTTFSDTEVLLELFALEGVACVKKLNGMFAFAIWDMQNKELFVFRDRVGIKPLFFYKDNNSFVFGSSLSSFSILPFIDFTVDKSNFIRQLKYGYVPAPYTIIKNINKLESGHYLRVDTEGRLEKHKYWEPVISSDKNKSIKDYEKELKILFQDIIKLQTRSDVPIGAFLSGGYDSSSVVSFLSETESKIKTFSLGFENGKDELPLAKLVAERFNTEHSEFVLKEKEILPTLLELIPFLDEPLADNSIIPIYYLSKKVKEKGIKVILNGTGGDEVFGGYGRYLSRFKYEKYFNLVPRVLQKLIGKLIYPFSKGHSLILQNPEATYFSKISGINTSFLSEIFINKNDFKFFLKSDGFSEGKIKYPIKDVKDLMKIDLQSYLVDNVLSLTDKMTMANSIEARVPLLDHRLIEWAYSIPFEKLLANGELKGFFKQFLKNKIPNELYGLKKSGFSGPTHQWVNGVLKEMLIKELVDEPIEFYKEIFDMESISKVLKVDNINPNKSETLFALAVFSLWYKTHINK